MSDAVAVDAKRILLRYGAPISVLDKVSEAERIAFARTVSRTTLAEREAVLRKLLIDLGYMKPVEPRGGKKSSSHKGNSGSTNKPAEKKPTRAAKPAEKKPARAVKSAVKKPAVKKPVRPAKAAKAKKPATAKKPAAPKKAPTRKTKKAPTRKAKKAPTRKTKKAPPRKTKKR